jgi:NitT/TauT family transport system substrate-binding protein
MQPIDARTGKLLLSFLLLLLLSIFNFDAQAQDLVRVGNLNFAHYGAVSYMSEVCGKYGIKIREKIFPRGIDIMPAIIAGEIDVAASSSDAAIAGRAGGAPIFAVAGFAKGGVRIVVRADLKIDSMAGLKGKKIGVTKGGAQELLLLAEIAEANLSWSHHPGKDVQVIYIAYEDLNKALQSGHIDAMAQSEPYASQSINHHFGKELLKPYNTPMGIPVRTLVMTEDLYSHKNSVAQRLLKCFVQSTKTFLEQPQLAEKYVRAKMFKGQISTQDYKDAIENSPFTYDLTVEHIQITTDMMQKYGVGKMKAPPEASTWVRLDLLAAAKKELGVTN